MLGEALVGGLAQGSGEEEREFVSSQEEAFRSFNHTDCVLVGSVG